MVDDAELNARLSRMAKAFRTTGRHTEMYGADTDPEQSRIGSCTYTEPETELQFSFFDPLLIKLFLAVCRKHGIRPFRYSRQKQTTVMVRAREQEFQRTVWMEFSLLEAELVSCLEGITDRLFEYITAEPEGDRGQSIR